MSANPGNEDMRKIAASFAELLHLLTHDGKAERPTEIRNLLVDRLRDALDRRLPSLTESEPSFIANTFLVEAVVHRNERTEVSRLRHRDLGTIHAMKTIGADRANEAVAKALLLREANIGMMLSGSNLAATQCAVRLPDGRPAIIMEWIEASLSQRLAGSPLSSADVKAGAKSILGGLSALHQAGYVHGDMSPANILLNDGDFNRLKIADFGTAIKCGSRYWELDIAKAATPGFAAPEISAESAMQFSADLYSAGCVIDLLLKHCDGADASIRQLRAAARHLADSNPSNRPPNAMAALALID